MANTFVSSQVLYGGVVTAQGTPDSTVAVSQGAITFSDVPTAFAAVAALTIPAADATYDRIDLVTVDSSGTVAVEAGAAQVGGVYPPASTNVILAQVYVENQAGQTYTGTITSDKITDARDLRIIPIDAGFFGTGSDGDVHITSSSFTLADPVDQFGSQNLIASGVLQRDAQFKTLTIDSGVTLNANGCVIQAQVLLAAGATIKTVGIAATTFAGATPSPQSQLGGPTAGRDGVTGTTGGQTVTLGCLLGGKGGNGGNGASGAGGTTALSKVFGPGVPSPWSIPYRVGTSGLGGCGGSGDGTNKGGGGGSGAPAIALIARVLDLTGTTLSATGGNGAAGQGGNTGGGGGGGGGWIMVYGINIGAPTYVVTGGTGGALAGTGTAGGNGSSGQHFITDLL